MPTAECSDTAGFTLLETIVAFLVLSVSLAVAIQSVSQSRTFVTRSQQQSESRFHARAIIAELDATVNAPMRRKGLRGGHVGWTVVIDEYSIADGSKLYSFVLKLTPDDTAGMQTTYVGIIGPR